MNLYTEAEDEINNEDRPELADTVDNMDSYDVIFIGYPINSGDYAPCYD